MKYGLLGEKLSHSFSKEIHEQIGDYTYDLLEVAPNCLEDFFKKRDFSAINVTIPYKECAIAYLDEIDAASAQIGAINTVLNRGGKLYGYNTDFLGLRLMLKNSGIQIEGKKVLILGSGGTSKTAYAVAKDGGAREILRVSRKKTDGCITYSEAVSHTDTQVIINTTPCGMYPNIDDCPIDITCFPALSGVADVIYNPLRSRLVLAAQERGINATGGLYMLVAQAVFAAEFFKNKKLPCGTIDEVFEKLYKSKLNIVLTGMAGCGKSTIGKALSDELSMNFIDTDDLIVKRIGCSIKEFFETCGEAAFRDVETEVIKECAALSHTVIATGGGAVLRAENITALKQNGMIYYLDRPLDTILPTETRPLSSNREDLSRRFLEREPIYKSTCDRHIKIGSQLDENVKTIKKDYTL